MALAHEETFDDSVMLLEKEGDFMIDEVSEKELLENNANSKQKDDILKKMMLEEDIEASAWNPASTLISNIKMDDLSAMDVMRLFYKSIFPFDKMYQWLTYGNSMSPSRFTVL